MAVAEGFGLLQAAGKLAGALGGFFGGSEKPSRVEQVKTAPTGTVQAALDQARRQAERGGLFARGAGKTAAIYEAELARRGLVPSLASAAQPGLNDPSGRPVPPPGQGPRPPTKAEQKMTSGPFGIPKVIFRRIPPQYQRAILIVWDRLPPEAQKRIRDGVTRAARTAKGLIKLWVLKKILEQEGIPVPEAPSRPGEAPEPTRPEPPPKRREYGGVPLPGDWPGPPYRLPPIPKAPEPRPKVVVIQAPAPVPVPAPQPVPVPQPRPVPVPAPAPLPPLPPVPRGPSQAAQRTLQIAQEIGRLIRQRREARRAGRTRPPALEVPPVPQLPTRADLAPSRLTTRQEAQDLTAVETAEARCIERCRQKRNQPKRKRTARTVCYRGSFVETATRRRLTRKERVPCK